MRVAIFLTVASATVAFAGISDLEQRQSNWTVGQTVQTSSGPVTGHSAVNGSQVSEYLGIPFAKAPIGDLRFAPPQKYTGSSTINGSSYVSLKYLDILQTLTAPIGSFLPRQVYHGHSSDH